MARVEAYRAADAESLAHDLRNVLASIRGYAQLLLPMTQDEKMIEPLATIESESIRCCGLIENMLKPPELSEAREPGSDAVRAAERVCNLARGEATLKGVELACEAEGGAVPAAIRQEDMERVLLNLVRNGIQATPRGGRVEVLARTCRLTGGAPGVEIEVRDTGRGIPEYARKMIFEPFFSTHNPGDGLGLGLTICSALVERCGGSIDLKSRERAGAVFTVRLPAGPSGPGLHGPDVPARA